MSRSIRRASCSALLDAGAIVIGKTNLDQFATGLVGTRSPYGAPSSTFDPRYISGGSSSGSAVVVCRGVVSFALGTDTAGSGACRPASTTWWAQADVRAAEHERRGSRMPLARLRVDLRAYGRRRRSQCWTSRRNSIRADPVSHDARGRRALLRDRRLPGRRAAPRATRILRQSRRGEAFAGAVAKLTELGAQSGRNRLCAVSRSGALLYEGPWVAERYVAIREFIERKPDACTR
jgi:allophanate hydrolase